MTLKVRSMAPQNNRDLNQCILHLWSKFSDPSLNGWWVMVRTSSKWVNFDVDLKIGLEGQGRLLPKTICDVVVLQVCVLSCPCCGSLEGSLVSCMWWCRPANFWKLFGVVLFAAPHGGVISASPRRFFHAIWKVFIQTRPPLERRKTLGHLRSINPNMINHYASQSQTCQLLKILKNFFFSNEKMWKVVQSITGWTDIQNLYRFSVVYIYIHIYVEFFASFWYVSKFTGWAIEEGRRVSGQYKKVV